MTQDKDGVALAIEAVDSLALTYGQTNWLSGVASGALYAFRTLQVPRQRVVLTELCGRLRAVDMEAVAQGAAMAVARLAEMDLPTLPPEGWTVSKAAAASHAETSGIVTLPKIPSEADNQGLPVVPETPVT